MQELKVQKKQKIPLTDYNFETDIKNRMLLKELSPEGIAVLEEILYSPVVIATGDLAENLEIEKEDLIAYLESLMPTELFVIDGDFLHINKEKRKYFEIHIEKFDEDFSGGMNYLQMLLKSVPIQFLPNWYHIPRSSNHIFNSIVEKLLLTPQIYQKHIKEYLALDDVAADIASEVHTSDEGSVSGEYLRKKYNLNETQYQEIVLELEFQFMCVQTYENTESGHTDALALIHEWKCYLDRSKKSKPAVISEPVSTYRSSEFSFIEDMSDLLTHASKHSIHVLFEQRSDSWIPTPDSLHAIAEKLSLDEIKLSYVARVINKLLLLGLVVIEDDLLTPTPLSQDWVDFPIQKRAHITFKHPHNAPSTEIIGEEFHPHDRRILEIQKHVAKAAASGWVSFKAFLDGAQIPFSDSKRVYLKQSGRNWRYAMPEYTEDECRFIHSIIFEWLYESGVVQIGTYGDEEAFCLSPLGKALFS